MNKKHLFSILAVIAAIAVLCTVYFCFRETSTQGTKNVVLEGFEYAETQNGFGPMVTSVNGEKAVYEEDGAYWGFYINGNYCNYGISDQPVNDKDKFTIAYTKA